MRFSVTVPGLLALTSIWLCPASSLPNPDTGNDDTPIDDAQVITRDFAIIGGGASGTYAAVRLQQLGHSVVLIEQEDHLGGHTSTYYGARTPIDYGVWVFSNTSEARDYFAHLNIPLTVENFDRDPSTNLRYDFRTGDPVDPPSGNITDAMTRYTLQLLQYPYLEDGFDLPDPVPEDLLLSFGDFIAKYDLAPAVETLRLYVQGYSDILDYPTIYIMKYFSLNVVNGIRFGYLRPASRANSDIYRAAQAQLGDENVLLSSTVDGMDRPNSDSDSPHTIHINTPSGPKNIQATKTIIAIPPLPEKLKAFDLNYHESRLFSKFRSSSYYSLLLHLQGLPETIQFINAGIDTPYNVSAIPGAYVLSPPPIKDLRNIFLGGGDTHLSFDEVRDLATDNVLSLRNAGFPVKEPEIVAYGDHSPFGLHVTAEEIAGGFYRELYGLQGYRNTFYTGAAFHAHDSAALWRFTERVLRERVLV